MRLRGRRAASSNATVAALALGLLASSGCSGCGADEEQAEEPSGAAATGGGEPAATGGSDDEATGEDPGPAPRVTVASERDHQGHVTPIVQSRGREPAKLARGLTVQQKVGDGWKPVAELSLRWSCEREPEGDCVTLVPGAELRPPAWALERGDGAQCGGCEGCEAAEAGRYRFVATSCGGAHELPGEPFSLEH